MTWHYQIRKRKHLNDKDHIYDIIEVYSRPFGYTLKGVMPIGDTRKEVIVNLERMLSDVKKYRTLIEVELTK